MQYGAPASRSASLAEVVELPRHDRLLRTTFPALWRRTKSASFLPSAESNTTFRHMILAEAFAA
jgi:hypothetical protein